MSELRFEWEVAEFGFICGTFNHGADVTLVPNEFLVNAYIDGSEVAKQAFLSEYEAKLTAEDWLMREGVSPDIEIEL